MERRGPYPRHVALGECPRRRGRPDAVRRVPEEVARGDGGGMGGQDGGEQRHPRADRRTGLIQDHLVQPYPAP